MSRFKNYLRRGPVIPEGKPFRYLAIIFTSTSPVIYVVDNFGVPTLLHLLCTMARNGNPIN